MAATGGSSTDEVTGWRVDDVWEQVEPLDWVLPGECMIRLEL